MLRFVVFLTLAVTVAHGFSGGAPVGVCKDLTPKHPAEPQSGPSPYVISVNRAKISPGEKVQVTIQGKDGEKFKGFILQARVGETIVGNFDVAERDREIQTLDCAPGKKNTVTHRNGDEKDKITVAWIAPKNLQETVVFTGTIVKNGLTFWVSEISPKLTIAQ